ncbi:MAG TPA: GNAT family protein [Candidatus Paceibacterota bacterium]|nr:GNAT family protein [Candidatus Paceibacterota bacterium]
MKTKQTFDVCTLVSDSIVIRQLASSDQEAIVTAGNDDQMQKWFPLPFPYTTENAKWFISDFAPERQHGGTGLVSAIDLDGKFAGVIDIKRAEWRGRSCEISYWTSPWARSKGVSTSALVILSHWIIQEMGFQRLEVRVAPGNLASQKVAEKAGFVREGIARNAGFTNHGRIDLIIYSRIPSDH